MKTDDRMLALSRMSPALRQETTVGLLALVPDKPLYSLFQCRDERSTTQRINELVSSQRLFTGRR